MGIHVGLDTGIASVGWCVIDSDVNSIVGLGVRTFTKAEDPKTGDSLARPRRLARSARRRLRRCRVRMQLLRELFVSSGLISEDGLKTVYVVTRESKTPYKLRAEGLDRLLSAEEWLRVLTQLCKRRGYKSMKLSAESDQDEGIVKVGQPRVARRLAAESDQDEGIVKEAIAANHALMQQKRYRTAGEMLARDERFADSRRNRGDYKGVISRELLLEEIAALFEAQRAFGSLHADASLETAYLDILTWQASIKEGEELLELVGLCGIDGVNKRIPLACYTFERFRVIDKLHNVRYTISPSYARVMLTQDERSAVLDKVFSKRTPCTYADVRRVCALSDDVRFVGVRYDRRNPDDISAEKKEKLPHPKAWHEMRKRVGDASAEAWDGLAASVDLLDRVAEVLTYYKLEASIRRELVALGLEGPTVDALSACRFSGNGHLSRQTLLAILPHMVVGMPYSEACDKAGTHHSQKAERQRHDKLPPIPADEVRNPVVLRALSQTRKVLNAIIGEYGPIEELHIELGRDVGRSIGDRRAIERGQKTRRAVRESELETMLSDFGIASPRPHDIAKFRLWKEQDGRCAYSGAYIDPRQMLSGEPGVAEVDHILPHSRSFDDGELNKVLVSSAENQKKRNKTPYEYLGHDAQLWQEFEERVRLLPVRRGKKKRLLRKDFDERAADEYRERNLVDMRYIARFFKNHVEANLRFAGENKAPVSTVNGRATAYLRTAWRLQKVRNDGDLHHALDAAVVAATTRSMIQAVSRFFSVRPLRSKDGVYVDRVTGEIVDAKHVPEPWDGFSGELSAMLEARFGADPLADMRDPDASPRPILVSRMPKRSVRGELHKKTIRRIEGEDAIGRLLTSKPVRLVENLTTPALERMVGKDRDRELHDALRARLEEHGGNGAKAFAAPFRKPSKPGRVAPLVRAVRVYDQPSSGGIGVRGGLADNGTMIRTDVFAKGGKYYLVPVYLDDALSGRLPRAACVASKAEKDWRQMDDSYVFRFSLCMNDLVRLTKRKDEDEQVIFGYYKGMNRANATITIEGHDSSWKRGSLGVVQGVVAFDKLVTDVLGQRVDTVRREKRCGFSIGHSSQ